MIFSLRKKPPARVPPRDELARRMQMPQRHRLLHGYPMAPLLSRWRVTGDPLRSFELDASRPLLIGVLPHTLCAPKVTGCGFCTSPHETFSRGKAHGVTVTVAAEIEATATRCASLPKRRVEAVYFGGGTANLTPPDDLARLFGALARTFDLSGAELTLEGIPIGFRSRDERALDLLGEAAVRHRRISMGVQTFAPDWLVAMGRDAFGDRALIASVVASAQRRGLTTSADLLINLPGSPASLALADVRTAIDIGFDQICPYNLVLVAGMKTEWARNKELVTAMPAPEQALATWLAVREELLAHGYVQTTLTNFERADVASSPRRFRYEVASFEPERYDAIGFGPGGISTFVSADGQQCIKWMNEENSSYYVSKVGPIGLSDEVRHATEWLFRYDAIDRRLLFLTRNFARLAVDGDVYRRCFGTEVTADFPGYFELFEEAGLVERRGSFFALTPRGMFFADAVAGTLAYRRAAEVKKDNTDLEHLHLRMG